MGNHIKMCFTEIMTMYGLKIEFKLFVKSKKTSKIMILLFIGLSLCFSIRNFAHDKKTHAIFYVLFLNAIS